MYYPLPLPWGRGLSLPRLPRSQAYMNPNEVSGGKIATLPGKGKSTHGPNTSRQAIIRRRSLWRRRSGDEESSSDMKNGLDAYDEGLGINTATRIRLQRRRGGQWRARWWASTSCELESLMSASCAWPLHTSSTPAQCQRQSPTRRSSCSAGCWIDE